MEIKLLNHWANGLSNGETEARPGRGVEPENWYVEPFTKRTGCRTPGQCGGDCDCGCPYNSLTEPERLPLIADIARLFPDEWLAFIIPPTEDDDLEPQHGKLVAHSSSPDDVYDAVNTVLWNQHIYLFFNGSFEALQGSYGDQWQPPSQPPAKRVSSGPKPLNLPATESLTMSAPVVPNDLVDLIYSALDQLYDTPNLPEANRRFRLARVRAVNHHHQLLQQLLDQTLDMLAGPLPRIDEIIWLVEESLAELEEAKGTYHDESH